MVYVPSAKRDDRDETAIGGDARRFSQPLQHDLLAAAARSPTVTFAEYDEFREVEFRVRDARRRSAPLLAELFQQRLDLVVLELDDLLLAFIGPVQ